jgi:hypothetical protein
VAPLVFKNVESDDRVAFRKDANGAVSHMLVGFPAVAFERLPFLERPTVHYVAGGVSLALFVSAVFAWPIVAWRRRKLPRADRPPRTPRLGAWFMSATLVVFVVGMAVVLSDPLEIAFGITASLKALLALPVVAAALTLVGLFNVIRAWSGAWWTIAGRVYFTLVVAAAVVFLVVLNHWNLFGYRY